MSHLIGGAAGPVLATLYCRLDPGWRPCAHRVISEWVASYEPARLADVMSGAAGALIAATEIAASGVWRLPRSFTSRLHAQCVAEIETWLDASADRPITLGLAHGLSGLIFAAELSRASFRHELRGALRSRALALLRESKFTIAGRAGAVWPLRHDDTFFNVHGWCHGGPGIALGLLGAYAVSRCRSYGALAHDALEGIMAARNGHPSTCCGVIGHAQILIEAYRLTGAARWLRAAKRLPRAVLPDHSIARVTTKGLWRGEQGVHFLQWRLRYPSLLPFPGLGRLSAVGDLARA